MADYQSLLTRAVANLPPSSPPSARQAIYERARKALVTQLRSLRPPLPEADILREETALDRAIAAVEAGLPKDDGAERAAAAPAGVHPPAAAPPAPAPAAPHVPAPAAPGPPPAPPRAAQAPSPPPAPPPAAAPPRAAQVPAPAPAPAQAQAAAPAARPARPPSPARPAAPLARPPETPRPAAPAVSTQPGPPSGAARSPPPPIRVSPPVAGGAAPPVALPPSAADRATADRFAAVAAGDGARAALATRAPPVVASRDDDDGADAPALDSPADERAAAPGRPEAEALRPVAPSAPDERRRAWPWAALAVALGIVVSIAVVAILMRQRPQDLAIAPAAGPAAEAPPQPSKIAQRAQPAAGGEPAGAPAASPPSGQPAADSAAPAAAPPAQGESQLPGAARAAMLVASADNPQKPVVNLGSTVWSTLPAPQGGSPAAVAVEADADIPDLKLHASMVLRKNTDPTLQATHTIDLKFTFQDGAPFTGFKDVGLPQMRKLDSAGSEALNSVKVKIGDDYFLFALAKGDQDAARNLDLMQTRAWFDFPLLLNDNRIAKLVFQKSADGQAMLQKALEAWK